MVCINNYFVLHHFREFTTFIANATACNLEKSFSFEKTVEIASHMRFPIHRLIYGLTYRNSLYKL